MKRICRILFLAAGILTFGLGSGAKAADRAQAVRDFLAGAGIPNSVTTQLTARVEADTTRTAWLVESDGQAYALAALNIPADRNPNMQAAVARARLTQAGAIARRTLFLFASGEKYAGSRYRNREAIANALIALDRIDVQGALAPGLDSSAKVIGDVAVALVHIPVSGIKTYRAHPPAEALFRDAYCAELYPAAHGLVRAGKYADALPVLSELCDLAWLNPDAYLDASECFLRIGKIEDAKKLARETLAQSATKMTSSQVERAGNILLEAGSEADAEHAFNVALEKLTKNR